MIRRIFNGLLSWIDAGMAAAGEGFIRNWTHVERAYRRPFAWVALRLGFAFYPLLVLGALGWLAWDWNHTKSLDAAEDAIFDQVIQWRPWEPPPSGRVVVVEIDECSIDYFRARGEGGWPWSRQRHADLLDSLDQGGIRAVGYDVLFADPSTEDPASDATLEAMAEGGAGRFIFASTRLHKDYDASAQLRMVDAPSAFAVVRPPRDNPKVAMQLPYGKNMARYSALANVTRNEDGVLRDIPLRENVGDWALASLPLQLAMAAGTQVAQPPAATVRPNWRRDTRLPHLSAADLLEGGKPICRDAKIPMPLLGGKIAVVGYTASGINDAKPTPVDPVMPGVDVLGEATEALVAGSAIRSPPTWVKYVLAALLVSLTAFAFFRGEPANDIDGIFVAVNLVLLSAAFVGLTAFGFFFDIFASVGFVSLAFGLCRLYAGVQRGYAVGNGDYLREFDSGEDRWLAMARLRFVPDPTDARSMARARREYRRRLRRFLYAGTRAVMLEGVVERKSWLHETLDDLMVLVWSGGDRATALQAATEELDALHAYLAAQDARLPDEGRVRLAFVWAELDDGQEGERGERLRLAELLGNVLETTVERPLSPSNRVT